MLCSQLLISYSSFQTGDSSISEDNDTEQNQQVEICIYQWIEAWHGDNDTGGSLGSSLRVGGSNDDAHRQVAHRLSQSSSRLARSLHAGSTVALS